MLRVHLWNASVEVRGASLVQDAIPIRQCSIWNAL